MRGSAECRMVQETELQKMEKGPMGMMIFHGPFLVQWNGEFCLLIWTHYRYNRVSEYLVTGTVQQFTKRPFYSDTTDSVKTE
jgi:hypothetical protein